MEKQIDIMIEHTKEKYLFLFSKLFNVIKTSHLE